MSRDINSENIKAGENHTQNYASLESRSGFLNRCTRCNQCKFVPVVKSQKHASICPSVDYGEFHSYSGGGQVVMAAGLVSGHVDYSPALIDSISACTMCGGCDVGCKINHAENVEPLDSLYALRARIVEDGQSPFAHQRMIAKLLELGNTLGKPRIDRADWAKSLTTKIEQNKKADLLLHIGANLSYDESKHNALRLIVSAIQSTDISISYLGAEEDSSGSTAFDLGYQDHARAFAKKFSEQVSKLNVSTVVTFSSAAIAAYRAIYPRFGVHLQGIRVLHITEYIQELIVQGKLSLSPSEKLESQSVVYHDSCKLGRLSEIWEPRDLGVDMVMGGYCASRAPEKLRFGNDGIYDAPRMLLKAMGINIVELERNRASSYCCGAAGGVKEALPDSASLAAKTCLEEVETSSASTLVSGCGNCANHLARNSSDSSKVLGLQVLDLLDLLGASLQPIDQSAEGEA